MSGRVIVVGSVNVDLVAHVERLPAPGETVTGATFARHHGGKGGEPGVGGRAARCAGRVRRRRRATTRSASEARAALEREGIDVRELATVAGPTGVALILVDAGGENLIAVASGANAALTAELVGAGARPPRARRPATSSSSATRSRRRRVAALLQRGREAGATVDPQPGAGDRARPPAFGLADIVTANRGELAS